VLRHELQTVLQMEREGEKRLALAREEAARIVEESRLQADRILRETEEEIAREKERRLARADEETARLAEEIRRRGKERERFLLAAAERNLKTGVARVLEWIRE
jgi:vacuolar-type H+-ATPase subunit H